MVKEIHLPSRQEIIDLMLEGTTLWWEKVDGDWVCYYADEQDVNDHIFGLECTVYLIKIYNHVLTFEEKGNIFRKEASMFITQEGGEVAKLLEYGRLD